MMRVVSQRLLNGNKLCKESDPLLSVTELSLNLRLKTDFLKVALMGWGRRPIFTPSTPRWLFFIYFLPTSMLSLNLSARWARFHPGGITSLSCFVVTRLVIKPPSYLPWRHWLASSLFLTFNRVTANTVSMWCVTSDGAGIPLPRFFLSFFIYLFPEIKWFAVQMTSSPETDGIASFWVQDT